MGFGELKDIGLGCRGLPGFWGDLEGLGLPFRVEEIDRFCCDLEGFGLLRGFGGVER